ncbi:Orotidine 5'-phosphate decarboxylase [Thalassocella blandensis]|nr:Orotidine 5'-phosphate decarboxylase [Thalassocella blandensis]
MSSQNTDPKIIVALDFDQKDACLRLVDQLDSQKCRLKIGKEMFTLFGPGLVENLQSKGFEIFLDLKFHDIPNTVNKAVAAAASLGVWMVNVHASGGPRMMEAAREALANNKSAPKLIAVTVLTSMEQSELQAIGIDQTPSAQVERLAKLTRESGLDGVVCSAQEASTIKQLCGPQFLCVTPGIRPADASQDDQRRIMTPETALQNGSDYLVIGRPITKAENPLTALQTIYQSISSLN